MRRAYIIVFILVVLSWYAFYTYGYQIGHQAGYSKGVAFESSTISSISNDSYARGYFSGIEEANKLYYDRAVKWESEQRD